MKILILTQALNTNYGGLLQAYALQKVLKQQGHHVVTDEKKYKPLFIKELIAPLGRILKRYILGKKKTIIYPQRTKKRISVNTSRFIKKNIQTIDFFTRKGLPKSKYSNQFDAIIVGSDQVWRPKYSEITNYFFDFADTFFPSAKRITYAASFGLDTIDEYSSELISQCSLLTKNIDAISVREDSGVYLCKQYFDVCAEHVLDPTLLLEKDEYLKLIEKEDAKFEKRILMCYVLDKSICKREIINAINKRLDLIIVEVMPSKQIGVDDFNAENDFIYPSVSKWLAGFRDAEFVVTDSFHGTVFSIIFNKPFIVIANEDRGLARFSSLLKIFGLESRIVYDLCQLNEGLFDDIDYSNVNRIKQEWVRKSIDFIIRATKFQVRTL